MFLATVPSAKTDKAFFVFGDPMTAKRYRIGILFSDSGPCGTVSRSMRYGAMLAFAEINRSSATSISLEPIAADPARYPELSAALLGQGIHHVVGCYTSSSRRPHHIAMAIGEDHVPEQSFRL